MSDNIALSLEELLSKDIIGGYYSYELEENPGVIDFGQIQSLTIISERRQLVEVKLFWAARRNPTTGEWKEIDFTKRYFPADALIQQQPKGRIAIENTRRLIYLRGVRLPVSFEQIELIQEPFSSPLRYFLASQARAA